MRRALLVLAALGACAPAANAAPRYRFTAETTALTTVTSTCKAREGGSTTTESMVWELRSTQTGTSAIGRRGRQPKGTTRLTGTLRRELTREIDGQPFGEPQGGTEPMQEDEDPYGVLYRKGRTRLELRLSHGGLLDPTFAPLAVGKSTTIVQDPPADSSSEQAAITEGGSCTDEERFDVVRRITVTRVS